MNFKDNEYIVRVWPSGTITMGKVVVFGSDDPMFKSLEDYSYEGGVLSGEIYGYITNLYNLCGDEVDYTNNITGSYIIRHRKPLNYEISLFESRGYLQLSVEEQLIMKRDVKISQILS